MRRIATVMAVTAATLVLGSGLANAQDSWPVDPGEGNPIRPVDVTDYVLTPDQPEFWNPAVGKPRVVSPFGRTTKIVCTGYRVYDQCWQADQNGNPHELKFLFNMGAFGSLAGAPPAQNVYVYPGMIPGL